MVSAPFYPVLNSSLLALGRTSTVIAGMQRALEQTDTGTNPLTIVIKSATTEDASQYTLIQRKGEAIRNPLLPASRALPTIFYEIEAGDNLNSTMEFLADLLTSKHEGSTQVVP
jgi:hypothetical protein